MPDCFLDTALVAAAVASLWRVQGARDRRRRQRFAVLAQISKQVLKRDFPRDWPASTSAAPQLPLGADTSAAAALNAVQRHQEHRQLRSKAGDLTIPDCSYGLLRFGGFGAEGPAVEVEDAICEELKVWLLAAATGAAPAEEVADRADFYRQVMMRPETFNDAAFLQLLATVCDRLEELLERLAGAVRGCAPQLSKVLACGRQMVEGLFPVLLLAITDSLDDGAVPLISVEALARSALAAEEGPAAQGSDVFSPLWKRDIGRILKALILSTHMQQVWCFELVKSRRDDDDSSVEGVWVHIRHKWMDIVDAGGTLEQAGLQEFFSGKSRRDLHQAYLWLFRHIDNVVKFLSIVLHFQRLASIAGDAAMYHLRERLHHLLQEIEHGSMQAFHVVARIMGEVRHTVIDTTMREPNPHGRRRLWIERLQYLDEAQTARSYRCMLEAIQQVRYLSSEARLPALQASCRDSLEQIAMITASPEFKKRCLEAPPSAVLPALSSVQGALALEAPPLMNGGPASPSGGAGGDALPPWSMERQMRVQAEDDEDGGGAGIGLPSGTALLRRGSAGELGEVVGGLNSGAIPSAEGDVCVVYCEHSKEYVGLYKPHKQEAALSALGLTAEPAPPAVLEAPQPAPEPAPVQTASASEAQTVATSPVSAASRRSSPRPGSAQSAPDQEQEQARYYDMLFNAVLPMLGDLDTERLSRRQAQALLMRADLEPRVLSDIMRLELGNGPEDDLCVGCEALRRLGQLVAHAQAGERDLIAAKGRLPPRPPQLRGLSWDGHKVSVLEFLS